MTGIGGYSPQVSRHTIRNYTYKFRILSVNAVLTDRLRQCRGSSRAAPMPGHLRHPLSRSYVWGTWDRPQPSEPRWKGSNAPCWSGSALRPGDQQGVILILDDDALSCW